MRSVVQMFNVLFPVTGAQWMRSHVRMFNVIFPVTGAQ